MVITIYSVSDFTKLKIYSKIIKIMMLTSQVWKKDTNFKVNSIPML